MLEQIEQKIPLKLKMNGIKHYIEPFVGGGGSKLKSTAGEYADIYHQWTKDDHQFIWLTDGFGWQKTQHPLRDTFNTTDYILNIAMVQKGVLEELLRQ